MKQKAQGLYDPKNEHDACGVGFVAHIKNMKSHDIVARGLQHSVQSRTSWRRGCRPAGRRRRRDSDPDSARAVPPPKRNGWESSLPVAGDYAVGMLFLPQRRRMHDAVCEETLESISPAPRVRSVLGWRDVPVQHIRSGREHQTGRTGYPPESSSASGANVRPIPTRSSASCSSSASKPTASVRTEICSTSPRHFLYRQSCRPAR